MKFSVSLYSFFKAIKKGELTPMQCIAKAKELGFDAVEVVDFVNIDCEPEDMLKRAEEIRAEADKQGIEISSVAIGANLLQPNEEALKAEIERIKRYVDFAAAVGAPRMRHDITFGFPEGEKITSYDKILPRVVGTVREIADYAQSKGVMTMTENHGMISQDSERVEKLYNEVNHPNFALLCDMGNFMCADEDPAMAVARVAPYVKYVHAKDFVWKSFYDANPGEGAFQTRAGNYLRGTIIGHGNVPVKQCLRTLKAAGYDDTIAIEFEGMEDPVDAVRIGLANLKRYWDEV